jgi:FtsH-binding integral membrane protein
MNGPGQRRKSTRVVAWIIAVSYLVGAPVAAFLEFSAQMMSGRFGYPPLFIYATCAAQIVLSVGILVPRFAVWSAAILTVIAVGAVASHLRIGSPLTALPALAYVALQLWFIATSRRQPAPR